MLSGVGDVVAKRIKGRSERTGRGVDVKEVGEIHGRTVLPCR